MPVSTHASDLVHALLAEVDPGRELAACGLRELTLGSEAVAEVAGTVERLLAAAPAGSAGDRPVVALLVDRAPIMRRGEDLKDLVQRQLEERFVVRRTVLDDGHAELHVVQDVLDQAARAARDAQAVVAVGAGTVSDIAKLAARREDGDGRPPVLVSVMTAASVDGYTDDVSVVLRDGVKRTVPSRWPDAVVADDETIAEAPAAMNRAGFGEMTSMLVAPADWRLASLIGTDTTFHEGPIRLLERVGADLEAWSPGVRTADPDSVSGLTRALVLRGVATGIAGTTAVLSGVEHLVSHMLDQHHTVHHLPMGLHGAQVGAAGVVAAAAWELLFDRLAVTPSPTIDETGLDPDVARAAVERAFGPLDPSGGIAGECWQDYSKKLQAVTRLRSRAEEVLACWEDHEPALRRLVRPSVDLARALRTAGSATTFAELDPAVGPEVARWAVANCAYMRNRFTVVDLLTLLGWWSDRDVDEVLNRAAAAVAAADEGVS